MIREARVRLLPLALPLVLEGLAGLATTVSAADLIQIEKRGSLRVLVSADEEPEMFSVTRSGPGGLEREMLEGFAQLHRVKLQPVVVKGFEDMIPALLQDQGDVIVGIRDTEGRRKVIDFTAETLPARDVVVTCKPHRVVATAEELQAEKVGVASGTSWADSAAAAGVPAARIEKLPDLPSAIDALREGKISATVMSLFDFTLMARRNPDLQAGLLLGLPGSAAWGVQKTSPQLKQALSEYVESFRKTPTWSRLILKYFGADALSALGRARKN